MREGRARKKIIEKFLTNRKVLFRIGVGWNNFVEEFLANYIFLLVILSEKIYSSTKEKKSNFLSFYFDCSSIKIKFYYVRSTHFLEQSHVASHKTLMNIYNLTEI